MTATRTVYTDPDEQIEDLYRQLRTEREAHDATRSTVEQVRRTERERVAAEVGNLHERLRVLRDQLNVAEQQLRTAYNGRAHVLALLATVWPAVRSRNDPKLPNLSVLYVSTITGQMSWHIDTEDEALFRHVPLVYGGDQRARWDGHDTVEKHHRVIRLIAKLRSGAQARDSDPL